MHFEVQKVWALFLSFLSMLNTIRQVTLSDFVVNTYFLATPFFNLSRPWENLENLNFLNIGHDGCLYHVVLTQKSIPGG